MSYTLPIYSDEELDAATSYPPLVRGNYRFSVIERTLSLSQKGFPQEKLILNVYHKPGQAMKCYLNFTFKPVEDESHKFLIAIAKKFLVCVGVEYTPDAFSRVLHREGRTDFDIREYKSKSGDMREAFVYTNPDKKKAPVIPPAPVAPPVATDFPDDDIPF